MRRVVLPTDGIASALSLPRADALRYNDVMTNPKTIHEVTTPMASTPVLYGSRQLTESMRAVRRNTILIAETFLNPASPSARPRRPAPSPRRWCTSPGSGPRPADPRGAASRLARRLRLPRAAGRRRPRKGASGPRRDPGAAATEGDRGPTGSISSPTSVSGGAGRPSWRRVGEPLRDAGRHEGARASAPRPDHRHGEDARRGASFHRPGLEGRGPRINDATETADYLRSLARPGRAVRSTSA